MWQNKLEEITQNLEVYGETLNTGATQVAVERCCDEIKKELQLEVPEDYARFLENVNGLEYNSFILYGVDMRFLDTKPKNSVNGLLDNNLDWYENEWEGSYVFLGDSSISWYVYDCATKKYYELDKPSGNEMEKFESLENMLKKLLKDALM